MRTLSEVNRDISECEALLNVAKTTEEALHLKALLYDLIDEKELIWETLFDGYKNMVI